MTAERQRRPLMMWVLMGICGVSRLPVLLSLEYATLKHNVLETNKFENENVTGAQYYRMLEIIDNYLFVGAMNYLYRLPLNDISARNEDFRTKHLGPAEKQLGRCILQTKPNTPDCQNHIRVVYKLRDDDDVLFVCSTGSYAPRQYHLNISTIAEVDPNDSTYYRAVARCPFDPFDNFTSIYIREGNPGDFAAQYAGTYTDFIKNFPIIYRPPLKWPNGTEEYTEKSTDTEDKKWLWAPQFVGSFDMNREVYFFFRETAVEDQGFEGKIHARVAKVCKKDIGVQIISVQRWISYQKTRLVCSMPGNQPYFFDNIQDVVYVNDGKEVMFFAVYNNEGGLGGSAICAFKQKDIAKAFNGSYQHNDNGVWEKLKPDQAPNVRFGDCSLYEDESTNFDDATSSQYYLMYEDVEPIKGQPLFYDPHVAMIKIVADEYEQHDMKKIMFYVGTDHGNVLKFGKYGLGDKTELVHVSTLSPLKKNESEPIREMAFHNRSLYLGMDRQVVQLNVSVCHQYKKIDSCIYDLYCYWDLDATANECKNITEDPRGNKRMITYYNINSTDVTKLEQYLNDHSVPICSEANLTAFDGVFVKLTINSKLTIRGDIRWRHNNEEMEYNNVVFLTKENSLIIKDSTNMSGTYIAEEWVGSLWRKVSQYNLGNPGGLAPLDIWKQEFCDWATEYRKWKCCSNVYTSSCGAGHAESTCAGASSYTCPYG